jgi:hypothetical protein
MPGESEPRESEQRATQVGASGTALPIANSMRRSIRGVSLPRERRNLALTELFEPQKHETRQ